MGTWHRTSPKHPAAHLEEMVFRFNRRKRADLVHWYTATHDYCPRFDFSTIDGLGSRWPKSSSLQHAQGKSVGHPQNQKRIPRAAALVMTASKKATAGLLEVSGVNALRMTSGGRRDPSWVRRKPAQDHSAGTMRGKDAHAPILKNAPPHAQGKRVGHPQNQKQIPRAAALVMTASRKAIAELLEA